MKSKKTIVNDTFVDSIFTYTEQTFKDSLEGSINVTKDNILIPDSLNITLIKNSFINVDDDSFEDKAAFFNNVKELTKNRICHSIESSAEKKPIDAETKKIHYKYMSNYQLSDELIRHKGNECFWFATYDKLINTKHLKKVLAYYSLPGASSSSDSELKEKALIIKDFELVLASKPFINKKKGSFIFVKLYYLPIQAINSIFNYINKIEHSLNMELFTFANMPGNNSSIEHNGMHYPYSSLCNLGSFLNVNIYTFTSKEDQHTSSSISVSPDQKHKLIKTHKISKMIKYLMNVFPYYSSDFFIYYFYQHSLKNKDQPVIRDQIAHIKEYLNKKLKPAKPTISNYCLNVNFTSQVCIEAVIGNNSKKNAENNKHNNTACSSFSASISKGPIQHNSNLMIKKKENPKHATVKSFQVKNKNPVKAMNTSSLLKINNSVSSNYKANISAATVVHRNNDSVQNQVSVKRNSIYVVNRKLKCEQEFNCDDDSSINTNKGNEAKVYLTPPKKKMSKYYS